MIQSQPSICIADTNIIIDLYQGGILAHLFQLPFQFAAPDVIVAELQDPEGAQVELMGMARLSLEPRQLIEVITLSRQYPRISVNDLQAFVLARDRKATLLTGDHALRRLARETGIPVHGTLWLLDEMVRLDVLSESEAATALKAMLDNNCRLPLEECETRLRRWE
ncbi:MAG: DUF3368 domain-containing protein [Anaerolineae bacterium]|nr:DUF3368 domain-containing protein [Anaerolineae bacterium]